MLPEKCKGRYFEPEPIPRRVRVTGRVFVDTDGDGKCSGRGHPFQGVFVSDEERILQTDSSGEFSFTCNIDEHRCVWIRLPSGYRPTTPWYQLIRQDDPKQEYHFEFGLQPCPASQPGKDFTFAVFADSQFDTKEDGLLLKQDMADLASMRESPQFFCNCGDVVMAGWMDEWDYYMDAITPLRQTLYHVLGGHESNYAMHTEMGRGSDHHFRLFCGPTHCAWDFAGVHFVICGNLINWYGSKATIKRQQKWLNADLASLAPGTDVVFFTHDAGLFFSSHRTLRKWARHCRIHAVMFGHNHQNLLYEFEGIPYIETAAIRGNDYGIFTRSFRLCRFRNGSLETEIRPVGQEKRLELISAIPSSKGNHVKISALAYNTRSEVSKVCAGVDDEIILRRKGRWTWQARVDAGLVKDDTLAIKAIDCAGESWQTKARMKKDISAASSVRVNEDWPWFYHNMRWSEEELNPPLHLAWQINTGSWNQKGNSPILYGKKLYFATQVNDLAPKQKPALICLSPKSGRQVWRFTLDGNSTFSPAAFEGRVFVFTNQGTVYAIDAETGRMDWSRNVWGRLRCRDRIHNAHSPLVLHDGCIIATIGHAGPIAMYDCRTGRQRMWRKDIPGANEFSAPFPHQDVFYWALRRKAAAQNIKSGEILWQDMPERTRTFDPRGSGMGAVKDGVFYQNMYPETRAFDCKSGKVLWRQMTNVGAIGSVPAIIVGPDTVISGGVERVCFDRETGRRLWSFETKIPTPQLKKNLRQTPGGMSTPCVAGGTVYFGGENGFLYALCQKTGKLLWEYYTGLPIKGSPIISGNSLFVTDTDGNLYAFVSK
jgi:outer membrane protein assembly factor BamB